MFVRISKDWDFFGVSKSNLLLSIIVKTSKLAGVPTPSLVLAETLKT